MQTTIIMVACVITFILMTWMLTEAFKGDGKLAAIKDPESVLALFVVAIITVVAVGGICDHTGIWGLPLCAGIYAAWNFLIIPGVKKVLEIVCAFM